MRGTEQRLGPSDEHRANQNIFAIVAILSSHRAVRKCHIEKKSSSDGSSRSASCLMS